MHIGIIVQFNDKTPSVLEVAPIIEERGFESMWVGEHTHMPVRSVHRYTQGRYQSRGWGPEGVVPDFYRRMADPYTTLSAASAVTRHLRIGTCIALPAEYNPIILAKQIATLDNISRGRLELGVGYGWNRLEAENNGLAFDNRRAILREKILAMQSLWSTESCGFDGRFVSFSESWSWPKPVQLPRPPLRIGGAAGSGIFGHIAEFADGWMPVHDHLAGSLASSIGDLRRCARAAGRDPATLTVDLVHAPARMEAGCSLDDFIGGLPGRAAIGEFQDLGLHRLLLSPPGDTLDTLQKALDCLADRYGQVVA